MAYETACPIYGRSGTEALTPGPARPALRFRVRCCSHHPSWGQQPAPGSVSSDGPHSSPFGDRNLLLGFGSHRVQLPGEEGTHFVCHWHVLGLKLLDVLDKVQDAGCLRGPRRDVGESWRTGLRKPRGTCRASLSPCGGPSQGRLEP